MPKNPRGGESTAVQWRAAVGQESRGEALEALGDVHFLRFGRSGRPCSLFSTSGKVW